MTSGQTAASLKNLLTDRQAKLLAFDDARLGLLGSTYSGGSWTIKKA
jgi:hypothetical protein